MHRAIVRRMQRASSLFVVLTATVACATACTFKTNASSGSGSSSTTNTVPSDTLATTDMQPSFSAQDYGDGSGVHVYAGWLASKGGWVALGGGDSVSATVAGQTTLLALEPDDPGKVHYTSTFSSGTGPVTVNIALARGGGQTAAPMSSTIVGAPFTITTAVPATITRTDKISIAIDPKPDPDKKGDGDSWQLTASGGCIDDFLQSDVNTALIDTKGEFTFDASALTLKQPSSGQNQNTSAGCDLTIFVKHVHYGKIDPAFSQAVGDLDLIVNDAADATFAVEGLQARVAHTTLQLQ
jgi:hypothetical protein